jgi:hypothetical protein
MLAATRERFVPGLVGVALVLAFIVNVSTKRTMCHDAGRSLETADCQHASGIGREPRRNAALTNAATLSAPTFRVR